PTVAAIQMCSSHLVDENLKTAAQLITKAAANGAILVVLPEMFAIMGMNDTDKVKVREPIGDGKIQTFLAAQAVKNKIWLVGGTIPIRCENIPKIRAACIVYNDKGKAVARYDKIHLFDVTISETESYKESETTEPGNELALVDTPIGKLGLAVCYDIRFPTMFTQLFKQGMEIMAIPAAFTIKTGQAHWQLLARSRAVENFCYVIGACQGGTHTNGRQTYGNTLIVEPWGSVQQELLEPGNGIVYSNINLEYLYKIRAAIPVSEHLK
ncbi:MAG: carbon-nitrogen hydrolase family protein, partial [Gammaproteobacteria bacterium]